MKKLLAIAIFAVAGLSVASADAFFGRSRCGSYADPCCPAQVIVDPCPTVVADPCCPETVVQTACPACPTC